MLNLMAVVQLVLLLGAGAGFVRMDLVYEWDQMHLQFPSPETKERITGNTNFYKNIYINGLEVHNDKLFVVLPWQLRNQVPTLTFVNLTDTSTESPMLIPYPNWGAYFPEGQEERSMGQVFRAHVDRCDRLWLLGRLRIDVFDLNTDTKIRAYTFPEALHFVAYLHWVVVEDKNCENTFAYVNDASSGGFWTYSWTENDSWRNDGYTYTTGIMLTPDRKDDFSTLYYQRNRMELIFVSTKHLRNESIVVSADKLTGLRSELVDLRKSVYDPTANTLYCASKTSIRVLPCWNKKIECHLDGVSEITVQADNITKIGDDMAVDKQGNLWIETSTGPRKTLHKISSTPDNDKPGNATNKSLIILQFNMYI